MSHPECEMPECKGSKEDQLRAVADPSDNLLKMCQSCLDEGWKGNVEILR